MSSFGGPRLILTVPGGSSRPNKTTSVKKSKFSKLSLIPFCQITADLKQLQVRNYEEIVRTISSLRSEFLEFIYYEQTIVSKTSL